jgi:hypothetical protein
MMLFANVELARTARCCRLMDCALAEQDEERVFAIGKVAWRFVMVFAGSTDVCI